MSLYMTPVLLLTNAPKQKTFAIDASLLSGIMFWYLFLVGFCGGSSCWVTGDAICCCSDLFFRVVLRIPWRGRVLWPFAVAGLGLRYFSISFLELLGHPFRKPFCAALRSVEIFGLHRDWCANFILFYRVEMEWANKATCLAVSGWVGSVVFGGVLWLALRGIVHKSVIGSFNPFRIVLLLYIISQWSLRNVTVHPASHRLVLQLLIQLIGSGLCVRWVFWVILGLLYHNNTSSWFLFHRGGWWLEDLLRFVCCQLVCLPWWRLLSRLCP